MPQRNITIHQSRCKILKISQWSFFSVLLRWIYLQVLVNYTSQFTWNYTIVMCNCSVNIYSYCCHFFCFLYTLLSILWWWECCIKIKRNFYISEFPNPNDKQIECPRSYPQQNCELLSNNENITTKTFVCVYYVQLSWSKIIVTVTSLFVIRYIINRHGYNEFRFLVFLFLLNLKAI